MKSLKDRLKKHEVTTRNAEWNKYDERLMKAVENGEVDKVTSTLKKGGAPTKLDAEGRSAFHQAVCKGLINCLNIFLDHGVDVKATNAAGKMALHLAAGNGHSSCVQRLLQCNCPVDWTDLHGRTALHDAALAGCNSVIKLLCDSGASVNAVDTDGRTALFLASQHPGACRLLLDCGAATGVRDKQNKTALILACESACQDAVEVLLKSKADVTAVDVHGYDAYHYARLSHSPELLTLVTGARDAATKARKKEGSGATSQPNQAKEAAKIAQKMQQTAQINPPSSGVGWVGGGVGKVDSVQLERHMRDHGSRGVEGRDAILVSHTHHLDSAQAKQAAPLSRQPSAQTAPTSRPVPRPVEAQPGEAEALRRELREARRRQEAAEQEVLRLESALALRAREYEELRRSGDRALREARGRGWELEEALGEVQHRMAGSEARVRQMQGHLVAVREHLVEQLRVGREAATAEAQRLHRELGQSRRELEERRGGQAQLLQEVRRLSQELLRTKEDGAEARRQLAAAVEEAGLRSSKAEETPHAGGKETPTDVSAETRRQRDAGGEEGDRVSARDHEEMRSSLSRALVHAEAQAEEALGRYHVAQEETASLLEEVREQKRELDLLQEALQARFVPLTVLEEKERELAQLTLALREMETRSQQEAQSSAAPLQTTALLEEGQSRGEEEREEERVEEREEERVEEREEEREEERDKERDEERVEEREEEREEEMPEPRAPGRGESEREELQASSSAEESGVLMQTCSESSDAGEQPSSRSAQTAGGHTEISEPLLEVEGQKVILCPPSAALDASVPGSGQTQPDGTLQAQVNSLQQQLADSERRYRDVLSIYRTRLLSAALGYMDEDARVALLQIAQMRQECVC